MTYSPAGANSLVRQVNEDTIIPITREDGFIETQLIRKGTNVCDLTLLRDPSSPVHGF